MGICEYSTRLKAEALEMIQGNLLRPLNIGKCVLLRDETQKNYHHLRGVRGSSKLADCCLDLP